MHCKILWTLHNQKKFKYVTKSSRVRSTLYAMQSLKTTTWNNCCTVQLRIWVPDAKSELTCCLGSLCIYSYHWWIHMFLKLVLLVFDVSPVIGMWLWKKLSWPINRLQFAGQIYKSMVALTSLSWPENSPCMDSYHSFIHVSITHWMHKCTQFTHTATSLFQAWRPRQ